MKRPKHVKAPAYLSASRRPCPSPAVEPAAARGRGRQAGPDPLWRLGKEGHCGRLLICRFLVARRAAEHRFRALRRSDIAPSARSPPRRRSACRCRVPCAMRSSTGAVCAPSATVRRSAIRSRALWPSPMALPSEKLRLLVEEQVSTRSPSPDRPASVSRRAPMARPKRIISAKPRAISAARAFWPSPRPSTTPQAMARTFLTAPPTSAPATSSVR